MSSFPGSRHKAKRKGYPRRPRADSKVKNMATVWVNDKPCGTVWTAPYQLEIKEVLKPGLNQVRIEVISTWANRMIGDAKLLVEKRITSTAYPFKMEGKALLPAGLMAR